MRRQQQGSILTLVLLGILAVGVLATIAYGSYYQITRGTLDTVNRAQSSALLTQGGYTLATETAAPGNNLDADSVNESPAGVTVLNDGFNVPATSGAPKSDAWGSNIQYCPWDNGSINASTGRLNGANPGDQNSLQFALISAGSDKTFNTTCAEVLARVTTHALVIANGDDMVRTKSVTQVNQGAGGTYFYGDPVANWAALTALSTTGTPPGMMRVTLDTQRPYLWDGSQWLPLNAGAWLVVVADAPCSAYPAGTLARDAADNLYMCTNGTRTWKMMLVPVP